MTTTLYNTECEQATPYEMPRLRNGTSAWPPPAPHPSAQRRWRRQSREPRLSVRQLSRGSTQGSLRRRDATHPLGETGCARGAFSADARDVGGPSDASSHGHANSCHRCIFARHVRGRARRCLTRVGPQFPATCGQVRADESAAQRRGLQCPAVGGEAIQTRTDVSRSKGRASRSLAALHVRSRVPREVERSAATTQGARAAAAGRFPALVGTY